MDVPHPATVGTDTAAEVALQVSNHRGVLAFRRMKVDGPAGGMKAPPSGACDPGSFAKRRDDLNPPKAGFDLSEHRFDGSRQAVARRGLSGGGSCHLKRCGQAQGDAQEQPGRTYATIVHHDNLYVVQFIGCHALRRLQRNSAPHQSARRCSALNKGEKKSTRSTRPNRRCQSGVPVWKTSDQGMRHIGKRFPDLPASRDLPVVIGRDCDRITAADGCLRSSSGACFPVVRTWIGAGCYALTLSSSIGRCGSCRRSR